LKNAKTYNWHYSWHLVKKRFFRVLRLFYTFLCVCSSVRARRGLKRCRNVFSTKLTNSVISIIAFSDSYCRYTTKKDSWLICQFSSILPLTTLNHAVPK
jgi:hypothetical protein